VAQLESRGLAQEYLVITSSLNGRLIKRNVDTGSYLNVGDSIGTAADLSSLWFFGNVFEADLPRLKIGQVVDIRVSGARSDRYQGRISFISPTFDPQTHAVSVRVDLPNPRGELRPEMFARAQVEVGLRKLPVVPRAAVVQDGAQLFVVVQRADGRYERAPVTAIETDDSQQLAITSGVQSGDRVVIEGSVLVDRSLANAVPASAIPAEKP
jgi:membrane fusion protein, copper/silver efflux system